MLLHFEHEVAGLVADGRVADEERGENWRKSAGAELDVNDVAEDLVNFSWSGLSTHKW